ncbi:hypothetical protein ACFVGY_14515 [Streptomyces sp. NPDC127106]|uniref:hypothetical protein n=1 Tax=Streptomyces sp. NPDC127106 TaxID=3345360 RepID=UPI0036412DF7
MMISVPRRPDRLLAMALHLRDQELSLREIAARLVITKGTKKGQRPPRRLSCECCASTTNRQPPRRPRRSMSSGLACVTGQEGNTGPSHARTGLPACWSWPAVFRPLVALSMT